MKRYLTILTLLSLVALAPAALVQRDSANFQNDALGTGLTGSYEGNVLPGSSGGSGPRWKASLTADVESVSGGILTVTTNNNAGTQSARYYRSDGAPTDFWAADSVSSVGWTIEMRAKFTNIDVTGWGPFGGWDGTQGGFLLVYGDKLVWDPNNTTFTFDTTDDYHDYRLAWDPAAGNFAFWIDDTLQSDSMPADSNTLERIYFGDTSTSKYGGTADVDYVRWDTTGAFAPIPEPATLALLGLGGAAVLLRRRR